MKFTKVIITTNNKIFNDIILKLDLNKNTNSPVEFYESNKWDDNIILVQTENDEDKILWIIEYLSNNYTINKIINIWLASYKTDIDMQDSDVMLPNTFINKDKKIFLEYAVWESYDLKKFWLILSWICNSGDIDENEDEFNAEIYDHESCNILHQAQKKWLLDKCVVVKALNNNDKNIETSIANWISVLELVL